MSRESNQNKTRIEGEENQFESARRNADLPDSAGDREKLRGDQSTIDMPEVKDIPGQEHVKVPSMGELADTTISSDDEEGTGLLDELNEEEDDDDFIRMGTEADVTRSDVGMLESGDSYYPSKDEDQLIAARMDSTDFEDEPLNEGSFGNVVSGSDLDVAGSDEDDLSEEIGEEDEENNEYSLGSDDNDDSEDQNG